MPTHVLLVEDDVGVAEVLAYGLEADGYTVEVAANGLLALAKIETHTYDVIISDLRMPELRRAVYRPRSGRCVLLEDEVRAVLRER